MMGRPKGSQKVRHRSDEIHLTDKEQHGTPLTTEPMYSSFKTKQGHWPGYGPKTGTRKPQDKEKQDKTPGPGDYGGQFSSFNKAAKTGVGKSTKEAGFGTSRRDEWMGDTRSPGVGAYDSTVAEKRRTDFRSPAAVPLMTGDRAMESRVEKTAPGPGEYGGSYSSFKKATARHPTTYNKEGKVASTFGNSFGRDEWRQESDAPGPCSYEVKDPAAPGMASKRSYRAPHAPPFAAGSSGRGNTAGEVTGLGAVAAAPATDAGPGDYVAVSDFDVGRRTFNTFMREQAETKAKATLPKRGRAGSYGSRARPTPARSRSASQTSNSSRRSSSGRRSAPRPPRFYDAADGQLM